jgi:hypothetical protein
VMDEYQEELLEMRAQQQDADELAEDAFEL